LIFYGIVISMVLLNLLLLFITKEKSYFWLSLFLFTTITNSHHQYGVGINFFPFIENWIGASSRTTISLLSLIIFAFFTINYLDIKRYAKLALALKITITVLTIILFANLFNIIPPRIFNKWIPMVFIIGTLIGMYTGVYAVIKKNKVAVYFLISFSMFLASSVLWFLVLHGIMKYSFILYHFYFIAVGLFSMMLSLGLMEKITAIKSEKNKLEMLEELNSRLRNEIEERKQLQEELLENEEKFRLLFHFSPQPIVVTDILTGKINDYNNNFCELLGLKSDEIIGKTSIELNIIDSPLRSRIIDNLKSQGSIKSFEINLKKQNGEIIFALYNAKLVTIKGKTCVISSLSPLRKVIMLLVD
jgi:PAS domain S-box-containing protein